MIKLLGAFLILVGIVLIVYTVKNPADEPDPLAANFRGYIGGLGFIIGGVFMLMDNPP